MKYLIALLTLILATQPTLTRCQTSSLTYNLSVFGANIGTMEVSKTIQGNLTKYSSKMESQIHLIGTTYVKTDQEVTFKDSVLISSSNKVWKNGQLFQSTEVTRNGTHYNITANEKTSVLALPITFSGIQLYFREPISISKIFFEADATFRPIVSSGANKFDLFEEGKHTNTYTYNSLGKLQNAIIDSGFVNVTLSLQ